MKILKMLLVLALLLVAALAIFKFYLGSKNKEENMDNTVYQFTVKGRKGEDVPLSLYKGKAMAGSRKPTVPASCSSARSAASPWM